MLGDHSETAMKAQSDRNLDDAVEYLANRLSAVSDRLDGFLARYHGGIPKSGQEPAATPVPSGYQGQLDRLERLVGEIESQANSITSIG